MLDLEHINRFLQDCLTKAGRQEVSAVEAANWLDEAGILSDRPNRRGLPLRRLLRNGLIVGQERRARDSEGRIWWISSVKSSGNS